MSSPGIGRDPDFSRNWNAVQAQRCKECGEWFSSMADFGRGKHAMLDRSTGSLYLICDSCYDKQMIKDKQPREEFMKTVHERTERLQTKTKKKKKKVSEEEEEDDEEEDEGDDEFKGFFHSLAGKAVENMFRHLERRLSKIEKEFFSKK